MPEKTDISQQIKKYLAGELNTRAMHELERRAQDDPFLMDALEGYQNIPVDINAGMADLAGRLQQRTAKKEARIIPWRTLSIAASILILLGAGLFWYTDRKPSETIQKNIAIAPAPPVPENAKPSTPATGNDTIVNSKTKNSATLLANNTKQRAGFHRLHVAADSEVATVASAPVEDKNTDVANVTEKAKDSTPLNEMIVMDYTAKKKADDVSQNKSDTLQSSSKEYVAKVKTDTLGLREVRIKGTDIAKLNESPGNSNASMIMPRVPSQNMMVYQSQAGRVNSEIGAASRSYMGATGSNASRGYFSKRPATGGGIAPLNPVILHGKVVNGIVKASGEPVEYATVKIKGTTISTLTDSKGRFTLYAVPDSAIIQVLADNYLLKETKVTRRDMQLISLRLGINSQNDVVLATNDSGLSDYLRPRPSTGWDDLNAYLRQNAVSPDGKMGMVKLSFTVNADNSLSDFKVIQGVSPQTDNAAIKLIKDGPAWYSSSDDKAGSITISIKFHAKGK